MSSQARPGREAGSPVLASLDRPESESYRDLGGPAALLARGSR